MRRDLVVSRVVNEKMLTIRYGVGLDQTSKFVLLEHEFQPGNRSKQMRACLRNLKKDNI
jgi:hypothetical protein